MALDTQQWVHCVEEVDHEIQEKVYAVENHELREGAHEVEDDYV